MRRVLIALGACLPLLAFGKHVYSWRDAQGVQHFSDQKPPDSTQFNAQRVRTENRVWVLERRVQLDNLTEHWLRNLMGGPIEVELGLVEQENLVTDPALPARIVLPADKEQLLFRASALVSGRYSYQFSYRYVPGDPRAQPPPDQIYALPFAPEQSWMVAQGFGGQFSHRDEYSFHAVDVALPVGTAIHAARGGVVMEVEEDFYDTGLDLARFGDRANHVRVLHDDGSMAIYAHLDLESVVVQVGERVRVGQKIAASGNTGYSTGPHLHFVVQQNLGMRIVSMPFLFQTGDGAVVPVEKMWLSQKPVPPATEPADADFAVPSGSR